jgi:hypothetical protein
MQMTPDQHVPRRARLPSPRTLEISKEKKSMKLGFNSRRIAFLEVPY